MKTRIFTLLMALFAFAWCAKADEITSMKLTISHNGGEFFTETFPSEGWTDLDLTDESSSSILIKRIEVQTSGKVSNVIFKATMYKTENGLRPDDGWRTFDLMQEGNTWVLDFGENAPDLIDSEMGSTPRTFRFFVQAKDGLGEDIYYNNGDEDYKVLFVRGGGSQPSAGIKSMTLTIRHNDGPAFTQSFPAENCQELVFEGQTKSLIIEKVEVEADASVSGLEFFGTMYSTYSGGSSGDEWRSFSLDKQGDGYWVLDMGSGVELVESKWLSENKTKTFRFYVKGQSASGKNIYYSNGGHDYKLTFSTGKNDVQKEGITSFSLTINCDGEVFTESFPETGWQNVVIGGKTASIKILKAEVEASESVSYVGLCSTMYDAEDLWQHDDTAWAWVAFENRGGGRWVLGFGDGKELIETGWLTENKTKTFEFFVDGGDSFGNKYQFCNGVSGEGYNNDYKVTFTAGTSGDDAIGLILATNRNEAAYNLAGQRVAEGYKGLVISGGKKFIKK